MVEVIDPNTQKSAGWPWDYDNLGNQVRNGDQWPAYSSETGLPVDQEVDANGNPPGTEYDAYGRPIFPLR